MKYSYNWLQKHIGESVRTPIEIEAMLTACAFEVEEVVDLGDDTILDIKVLPDRSHDALSHLGMAREILSLYRRPGDAGLVKQFCYSDIDKKSTLPAPGVMIEDTKACPRFMAMTIRNIKVGPSNQEIKKLLEAIGQKSINNIVDVTNYVLYDLGKPMHVFDADKVVGTITVRFAKIGEELTTLDGKNIKLDETILVIADEQGPLSIAGIKGGTRAEVDINTTSIVIESANFSSTLLRKTSTKVGIKTDAVRRFENGITSELCEPGLLATANLILQTASTAKTEISGITDIYPRREVQYKVGVSTSEINKVLGKELSSERVRNLLAQRDFEFEEKNVFNEVVRLAKESLDAPYKRGASVLYDAPTVFDCSSLTAYLYKEVGIAIPRIAVDQYVFSYERIGEPQLGDLLFLNTGVEKTNAGSHYSQVLGKDIAESAIRYESVEWIPGTKVETGIDHVGIYIGDGYVVQATSSVGKVLCEKISESNLFKKGYTARYIIKENESRFVVTVPFERLDIRIKEDLVDEIGKLVGTSDSKPTTTYENATIGTLDKNTYYTSLVRNLLIAEGFSEVMNSSFSMIGDTGIVNSVDPTKNKLRNDLINFGGLGLTDTMLKAIYFKDFLGEEEVIKVFEIGSVFKDGIEKTNIIIGFTAKSKKLKKEFKSLIRETYEYLCKSIPFISLPNANFLSDINGDETVEFTLDTKDIQEPDSREYFTNKDYKSNTKYQTLSNYPFITRDIAFFVPGGTDILEVENMIRENVSDLCVKFYRFDEFPKDGKVSYGYRLIFQSFDKTLTDTEVQPYMDKVYKSLSEQGFEVR